jgi:hypothetical protein
MLDDTPCPNCGRCAFCGRKLKADQAHCGCAAAESSEVRSKFITPFLIPEELVARETRRMEIRKQLDLKRAIASGLMFGAILVFANTLRDNFAGWTWAGLVIYYIVLFLGAMLLNSFVDWMFRRIEDSKLDAEELRSRRTGITA